MSRTRTLPAVTDVPTHNGRIVKGVTMTECAIHTVELQEGHFAAIVLSRPTSEVATIAYLDRDEVEAHIKLLINAINDADRLDAGQPAVHAAPTLIRQ